MISIVVFALVLMSGSIFAGTYFHRKFGDTIPFSAMGIILVLFCCGALGFLKAGVYLILFAALVLWALSAIRLIREKRIGALIRTDFGLEGLFFILLYFVLVILNNGRVAWYTDEISHWMDCVKAMSNIDDFAANYTLSHSLFPSYPPGMALFQYFFQKLHEIFDGTVLFCEWRPYVAFQLFAFILFFPCMRQMKYHRLAKPVLFGCAMLMPLVMYPGFFFESILIDSMIGVMAGAGFVYLLMDDNRQMSDQVVFISMLCSVLVLMKDAGLFFAVFIAIAFVLYTFGGNRSKELLGDPGKKRAGAVWTGLTALVPLLSALCAKGSWNLILNRFHTPRSFSDPIQIGEYLRLFFTGGGSGYQQETVDQFKKAFTDPSGFQIHNGMTVSYLLVVVALFVLTALLMILLTKNAKKEGNPGKGRRVILLGAVLSLQTLVYIFFLGAVYISNFSEYEAVGLASYERYIRMAILPQAMWVVWAALYWLQTKKGVLKYVPAFALAALILLLCPVRETKIFVTRELVRESLEHREPYREIQEGAEKQLRPEDRVFFATDGNADPDTVQFVLRPYSIAGTGGIAEKDTLESYDYLIEDHDGRIRWIQLH